ncbi:hypothetical protein [Streptomyces sp. NPDC001100]
MNAAADVRRPVELLIAEVQTDQVPDDLPLGGYSLRDLFQRQLLGGQLLDELPQGEAPVLSTEWWCRA